MSTSEGLRGQTAGALRRLPAPGDGYPGVGDLMIAGVDDRRPDFWLVAGEGEAGYHLVPVDIDPMLGRFDVALDGRSELGALTARCAHALWLKRIGSFTSAAVVDERGLADVRRALEALDRGIELGTELELETEEELEYRDLVTEIDEARSRLRESAAAVGPRAIDDRPAPAPARSSRRATRWRVSMPLAASWLACIGLGVLLGLVLDSAPHGPPAPEPLAGVPFDWLAPQGQIRGEPPQILAVDPEVPYLALFLQVGMVAETSAYRLELRQPSGQLRWSREAWRADTGEILVLVPTTGLAPGDYSLLLFESSAGEPDAEPLSVYALRLVSPRH